MTKLYKATGKRKSSIAQVVMKAGNGKITVNSKDVREFFPYETNVMDLMQPLVNTGNAENFDVDVRVNGGGFSGQAGATRLGIAKALLAYEGEAADKTIRHQLKTAGFITRDSRTKERKKPGLKGARKAPQFSKR